MKIIAEVSSNWHSLDDILYSVKKAKDAGATDFKLQLFSMSDLYGSHEPEVIKGVSPVIEPFWIPTIADECRMQGIGFMCTAFSVAGYEYVNRFVDTHKIASAELTDINLLRAVNSFKKPVILSTAGSDLEEISNALLYLTQCPVTIMFCVGEYPARVVDFRQLELLQSHFGLGYTYGYSDHSTDVLNIPYYAKLQGCEVIEKHVNFTNHKDTADAPHSLNFEEFSLMSRKLLNDHIPLKEIDDKTNVLMKNFYKRRFIAIEEIKQGDKFVLNKNVGIHRAKVHVENPVITFRYWDLENKIANQDKKIGDVICYSDIEV